ncbi:hypothetical protein BH10PSE18_BH10PSE18_07510 [soil metagenome]
MVTPSGSPVLVRPAADATLLQRPSTSADSPGSARVGGHLAAELEQLKPSGALEVTAPPEPIQVLMARASPARQGAKFWQAPETRTAAPDTAAAPRGAPDFDRCVGTLKDFAHNCGGSGLVAQQLDSLQLQTSGELNGSIRQIQDKDLYGPTLDWLERIAAVLMDPSVPLGTRRMLLDELCSGSLDQCAGGVSNIIEIVAVRAELLSHGVLGAATAFRMSMLTETLQALGRQEDIGVAYETHWGKAITQRLAATCGLPWLQDDVTVVYDDIPRTVVARARTELMKKCDAASLIDHLTSKIYEEASHEFSGQMRTRFAGMAGMPVNDALEFCKQVAERAAAVNGVRLDPAKLCTELLEYHCDDEGEYCTMRCDPTLLQSRVQDELDQAGLIDVSAVTLARMDGNCHLRFDGTLFYVDTPAGRRALAPLELARQEPADFGPHARALALNVILGNQREDLKGFPDKWVLGAEVACALIQQLPPSEVVARMRSPALRELQRSATPAQRNELVVTALQSGMSVRELVGMSWVDLRGDVSNLIVSLIEHGRGDAVTALVNDHHVRRPMHKLRIEDWTRNPASKAIHAGDEALYRLLRKAGWSPGGVPGRLHASTALVDLLVSGGRTTGLQILIDEGYLDEPRIVLPVIGRAATAGHPAVVAALLPKVPAKELRPALQKAITNGHVGATIVLLQHLHKEPKTRAELHAFLNDRSMTYMEMERDPARGRRLVDRYPLQVAIERGDVEMARCLLQAGCNIARSAEFDAMAEAQRAGPEMLAVLEQQQALERERAVLASPRR